MHFSIDQQIELLTAVAKLNRSVVVINQNLDSGCQQFRWRLEQWLGNQSPARFPISDKDIRFLLGKSCMREMRRYRLLPLIREVVYIIAEKI